MVRKSDTRQASLFALPSVEAPDRMFDFYIPNEDGRVDAAARFIIERHKIYLKRSLGKPKPWTTDPVLRVGKFTNIYREIDPGTTWIIDNIIKPYEDHPDLWFMAAMARLINWPDTLQELMDERVWPDRNNWNPDKVYGVLRSRHQRKEKLITGAYIVNSVFPSDYAKKEGTKAEYIPYLGLDPLWQDRKDIRAAFKTTMAEASQTLGSYRGWGPFLTNQALVDLTYSRKWLGRAADLNTFTSPGPGTIKGMNWMITGKMNGGIAGNKMRDDMIRFRNLVNARVKALVPSKHYTGDFKTGFAEISMPNYSNCNCELSKMIRSIKDGDGSRMKNKYNGG